MVAKEAVFDVIIIAGEPWCLSLTHPLPTFQNIFTQRSPPTARPRVLQQPSNTTSSASAQCLCYYQRFLFRGFQFSVFSTGRGKNNKLMGQKSLLRGLPLQ
jgi:hypothetical protein